MMDQSSSESEAGVELELEQFDEVFPQEENRPVIPPYAFGLQQQGHSGAPDDIAHRTIYEASSQGLRPVEMTPEAAEKIRREVSHSIRRDTDALRDQFMNEVRAQAEKLNPDQNKNRVRARIEERKQYYQNIASRSKEPKPANDVVREGFTSPGNVLKQQESLLNENKFVPTRVLQAEHSRRFKEGFRRWYESERDREERSERIAVHANDPLRTNNLNRVLPSNSTRGDEPPPPDSIGNQLTEPHELDRLNKPRITQHLIDSRDRDYDLYPRPNQYQIALSRRFSDVKRVRLISSEIPNTDLLIRDDPREALFTRNRLLLKCGEVLNDANKHFYWINDEDAVDPNSYECIVYDGCITPGNYVTQACECDERTLAEEIETVVSGINRFSDGTPHEFIVTIDPQTNIVSVQSIQSDRLGLDPISTVAGTNVVTVEHLQHPFEVGDIATISGAVATGGIPASVLNGNHEVIEVPDANTYVIRVTTIASETGSGGGSNVLSGVEKPFMLLASNVDTPFSSVLGFPQQDSAQQIATDIEFIDTSPPDLSVDPTEPTEPGELPARIYATDHCLNVGDEILILDTDTIPDINGLQTVTSVIDENQFEIGEVVKVVNNQVVTTTTRLGTIKRSLDSEITCGNLISEAMEGNLKTDGPHGLIEGDGVFIGNANGVLLGTTGSENDLNGFHTVGTVLDTDCFRLTERILFDNPGMNNTPHVFLVQTSSTELNPISQVIPENNGVIVPALSETPFGGSDVPDYVFFRGTDTSNVDIDGDITIEVDTVAGNVATSCGSELWTTGANGGMWQTFTPSEDVDLVGVYVRLGRTANNVDVSMRIYQGSSPATGVFLTESTDRSIFADADSGIMFCIENEPLTAGTEYVWQIRNPSIALSLDVCTTTGVYGETSNFGGGKVIEAQILVSNGIKEVDFYSTMTGRFDLVEPICEIASQPSNQLFIRSEDPDLKCIDNAELASNGTFKFFNAHGCSAGDRFYVRKENPPLDTTLPIVDPNVVGIRTVDQVLNAFDLSTLTVIDFSSYEGSVIDDTLFTIKTEDIAPTVIQNIYPDSNGYLGRDREGGGTGPCATEDTVCSVCPDDVLVFRGSILKDATFSYDVTGPDGINRSLDVPITQCHDVRNSFIDVSPNCDDIFDLQTVVEKGIPFYRPLDIWANNAEVYGIAPPLGVDEYGFQLWDGVVTPADMRSLGHPRAKFYYFNTWNTGVFPIVYEKYTTAPFSSSDQAKLVGEFSGVGGDYSKFVPDGWMLLYDRLGGPSGIVFGHGGQMRWYPYFVDRSVNNVYFWDNTSTEKPGTGGNSGDDIDSFENGLADNANGRWLVVKSTCFPLLAAVAIAVSGSSWILTFPTSAPFVQYRSVFSSTNHWLAAIPSTGEIFIRAPSTVGSPASRPNTYANHGMQDGIYDYTISGMTMTLTAGSGNSSTPVNDPEDYALLLFVDTIPSTNFVVSSGVGQTFLNNEGDDYLGQFVKLDTTGTIAGHNGTFSERWISAHPNTSEVSISATNTLSAGDFVYLSLTTRISTSYGIGFDGGSELQNTPTPPFIDHVPGDFEGNFPIRVYEVKEGFRWRLGYTDQRSGVITGRGDPFATFISPNNCIWPASSSSPGHDVIIRGTTPAPFKKVCSGGTTTKFDFRATMIVFSTEIWGEPYVRTVRVDQTLYSTGTGEDINILSGFPAGVNMSNLKNTYILSINTDEDVYAYDTMANRVHPWVTQSYGGMLARVTSASPSSFTLELGQVGFVVNPSEHELFVGHTISWHKACDTAWTDVKRLFCDSYTGMFESQAHSITEGVDDIYIGLGTVTNDVNGYHDPSSIIVIDSNFFTLTDIAGGITTSDTSGSAAEFVFPASGAMENQIDDITAQTSGFILSIDHGLSIGDRVFFTNDTNINDGLSNELRNDFFTVGSTNFTSDTFSLTIALDSLGPTLGGYGDGSFGVGHFFRAPDGETEHDILRIDPKTTGVFISPDSTGFPILANTCVLFTDGEYSDSDVLSVKDRIANVTPYQTVSPAYSPTQFTSGEIVLTVADIEAAGGISLGGNHVDPIDTDDINHPGLNGLSWILADDCRKVNITDINRDSNGCLGPPTPDLEPGDTIWIISEHDTTPDLNGAHVVSYVDLSANRAFFELEDVIITDGDGPLIDFTANGEPFCNGNIQYFEIPALAEGVTDPCFNINEITTECPTVLRVTAHGYTVGSTISVYIEGSLTDPSINSEDVGIINDVLVLDEDTLQLPMFNNGDPTANLCVQEVLNATNLLIDPRGRFSKQILSTNCGPARLTYDEGNCQVIVTTTERSNLDTVVSYPLISSTPNATGVNVITVDVPVGVSIDSLWQPGTIVTLTGIIGGDPYVNGDYKIFDVQPNQFKILTNATALSTGGTGGFVTGPAPPTVYGHGLTDGDLVHFGGGVMTKPPITEQSFVAHVIDDTTFAVDFKVDEILCSGTWCTNWVNAEIKDHGLVDGDIFFLYSSQCVGGLLPEDINTVHGAKRNNIPTEEEVATRKVVRVVDGNNIQFLANYDAFPTARKRGGGYEICISARNHTNAEKAMGLKNYGFDGVQTNLECLGDLQNFLNFNNEAYILMCSDRLTLDDINPVVNTGSVDKVFSKIQLSDDPGEVMFNTYVGGERIFYEPISRLDKIDIEFRRPDGKLFDFRGREHSFTLEIEEYQDRLRTANKSSRRGINDPGQIGSIGLVESAISRENPTQNLAGAINPAQFSGVTSLTKRAQ